LELVDFGGISSLEYDQLLSDFSVENIPLSRPTLLSGFILESPEVTIVSRKADNPTLEEAHIPKDYWGIELPWDCDYSQKEFYNHLDYDRHSFLVAPGGKTQWHIPGQCNYYACVVSTENLSKQLTSKEIDSFLENSSRYKRGRIEKNIISSASMRIRNTILEFRKKSKSMGNSNLDWYLGEVFREIILATTPVFSTNNLVSRAKILAKSRDYIHYNYGSAICVSDIADFSSTTVRTLQNIYLSNYGISPMNYLKSYRLYRYFESIKKGHSKSFSATSSGFNHLGRVSQNFKKLYHFP
jgi:AraC-like DNA-binding protein